MTGTTGMSFLSWSTWIVIPQDFSCHFCKCHCSHQEPKTFHLFLRLKRTGHVNTCILSCNVWNSTNWGVPEYHPHPPPPTPPASLGVSIFISSSNIKVFCNCRRNENAASERQYKELVLASKIQQWDEVGETMCLRPLFWYWHGNQFKWMCVTKKPTHWSGTAHRCC